MKNDIIDQDLQAFRARMDDLIKDLHQLTIDIHHDELAQTVSDLRTRINEPFMFVIVGEVKAGKSSFVNALLDAGAEVVEAAPQPMTDTIQEVTYGEKDQIVEINPFLKRIMHPVEILKEISIVDTPGTNTIIEKHQEITEGFIPSSDLIVFVFEAKNPYRQSAWDFLKFIHKDWRRKIIFVLQQKDLMAPEDLQVNLEGVKKQAISSEVENPLVFAVSAKQEMEGDKEASGFKSVRQYIQDNITGGKAPFLKLQNNINTAHTLMGRIQEGLKTREAQYNADTIFREDVKQTLTDQENRSNNQVDLLIESLLADYDRITGATYQEISGGLNFFRLTGRSFRSIFNRNASIKEWLNQTAEKMEAELNQSFSQKLNTGVVDIAESIQQMAKLIDLKIQNSETILKRDHAIFGDIADKRSRVLRDLQEAFSKFMDNSENFVGRGVFEGQHEISPNLATASGLAVIGVVLATVTNGIAFDITGGIITGIGLLIAGFTVITKRRRILKELSQEIATARERLKGELSQNLKAYIQNISQQIDGKFSNFDAMLTFEAEQLQKLNGQFDSLNQRVGEIDKEVNGRN
ncbi:MAG: dynamin family protein [Bacteroidota bacterium]